MRESSSPLRTFFIAAVMLTVALAGCTDPPNDAGPPETSSEPPAEYQFAPPLHVEGSSIRNNDSEGVRLTGLATEQAWQYDEDQIRYLKEEWNVSVIRLPLLPKDWYYVDQSARTSYLQHVDRFLDWTRKYGIYVVLDGWQKPGDPTHIEGDLTTAWDILAERYRDQPHVIWNIYNEPNDTVSWGEWVPLAERLIDTVRSHNPVSKVVTVDGVRWARDFNLEEGPTVQRDNVIYAAHPYPDAYGGPETWNAQTWDAAFGRIPEKHNSPVMIEEWGFPHHGKGDTEYGESLLGYSRDRNLSWIGWIYSDNWTPRMFRGGDPTDRTPFGQLVWAALSRGS